MTTPNAELNTACAHSIVAHSTISGSEPGTVRDAWACCDCGARFNPDLSLPMFTPEPSHLHAKVSALCTALAASDARVAELERDAERYRWLREQNRNTNPDRAYASIAFNVGHDWLPADDLDAAIDAARSAP